MAVVRACPLLTYRPSDAPWKDFDAVKANNSHFFKVFQVSFIKIEMIKAQKTVAKLFRVCSFEKIRPENNRSVEIV